MVVIASSRYSIYYRIINIICQLRRCSIYIYIVLISTVVELLTTYVIDFMKSDWRKLWDYSNMFLNFQGRIALKTSLKFGLVGIIGVYLVIPLI